ncbi:hypothetical protein [Stenomitos frigidus]|nr:hypothetical protein [Stenomitos frigidus]
MTLFPQLRAIALEPIIQGRSSVCGEGRSPLSQSCRGDRYC